MKTDHKSMQALWQESYLAADNDEYIESLYETYLNNPNDLSDPWREFFDKLPQTKKNGERDVSHQAIQQAFLNLAKSRRATFGKPEASEDEVTANQKIMALVNAYRQHGHLQARIDPLGLMQPVKNQSLDLEYYGFTAADHQRIFQVEFFKALGKSTASLDEIHDALRNIYCGDIGFEYMNIDRLEEVEWIQNRIEEGWAHFKLDSEQRRALLERLVVADGLEKYLGFKYVGQKRFSLEGGDALIPLLDTILKTSTQLGVKEAVFGMAHRGRLNVLVNIIGKNPKEIFAAFEGKGVRDAHSGDVKYHLGYSSDILTPSGPLHLALAFNPSHLEIVAPVVQGSVRARQRRNADKSQSQVLPIQLHGDAAFSSQGVVMETFSMSQARWFTVGGSIHIVINNQIGFTISNPLDARSSIYPTDSAKMVEAPVLHVNGNKVEAVYFAAIFAIEYRQRFKRDVVIDLVCYRRQGHNEADEPSATQPKMYKVIRAMPVPYQLYAQQLMAEGVVTEEEVKSWVQGYRQAMDEGQPAVKTTQHSEVALVDWQPFEDTQWDVEVKTAVDKKTLLTIAKALQNIPSDFVIQPQVLKTLEAQKRMTEGEIPINWGYAETLAYGSLLAEGFPIRLCGQDAGRGTFAHRHAILYDQKSDRVYLPLSHIATNQAQINVVDSLLSEEGVLAFEYGYATAEPNFLVIWEAQYGDFANGAQVVIDQFISSGEQKWGRLCGLVMLLPHGYEGGGPEHSSARLERYLQLCSQDNMQVCAPSTPAQMFHLLRRQMIRPYRKPLIVMTPKSFLRNPVATSAFEELTKGTYQLVIPEIDSLASKTIKRVILCAGKVYYELLKKRRDHKIDDIALIRIEQFYPFPEKAYQQVLNEYAHVKEIIWCQEEPQNQGAWTMLQPYLLAHLQKNQTLAYVGRKSAAAPASGYHNVHEKEQQQLVSEALKIKS